MISLHPKRKRILIEKNNNQISIVKQAELLGIARSTVYYKERRLSELDFFLMNEVDKIYCEHPYYGTRKISKELQRRGYKIGRDKTRSLMKNLGLEAIYPKPKTSIGNKEHELYKYLLRRISIKKPNQVWGVDITYIRMLQGWVYLVAIMDWFSRFVLSWEISITLESQFCVQCLNNALKIAKPKIHNSDQGSQFTSTNYLTILKENEIQISMDAKGRCFDNIFTERLWRSLKYEEVYPKNYQSIREVKKGLGEYFKKYNYRRLHQSLDYQTPYEIYSKQ